MRLFSVPRAFSLISSSSLLYLNRQDGIVNILSVRSCVCSSFSCLTHRQILYIYMSIRLRCLMLWISWEPVYSVIIGVLKQTVVFFSLQVPTSPIASDLPTTRTIPCYWRKRRSGPRCSLKCSRKSERCRPSSFSSAHILTPIYTRTRRVLIHVTKMIRSLIQRTQRWGSRLNKRVSSDILRWSPHRLGHHKFLRELRWLRYELHLISAHT